MVTINDKIGLIVDVDNLFKLNDPKVADMINGDVYLIDSLYKEALDIFRHNLNYNFTLIIEHCTSSLFNWASKYDCDLDDSMSICIFLRWAAVALRRY